jgi:tRNA(Ile)-lysidine synthase TilS/MesJ
MHRADIDRIAKRLGYSWEHTASLVRRKHLLRFADRESGGRPAVMTGHNFSDYLETLALRRARQIPETSMPALEFSDAYTGFLRPLYQLTREQ